ncbi:MAG: NAD-dependent epimerase/dehydratase family protein [Anaerolineae bacterium]
MTTPRTSPGRILVTGSAGQIGSELTVALRASYGAERVVAGYHRTLPGEALQEGPCERVDVTDRASLEAVVERYGVDTIFHLAAMLSAVGEANPQAAWHVNVDGLVNVLEVAREKGLRVFNPSSIAVFGPEATRGTGGLAPQEAVLRPTTIYGVAKVAGELLAEYYVNRYDIDVLGLRYPGIISSETLPGGGTTDYAVAIFYAAVAGEPYTCYLRPDTMLPMMYMPDSIAATLQLMDHPGPLRYPASYNLAGMSFTPAMLAAEIRHHIPGFICTYAPDARQAIADSWPRSIDDRAAREDWGWAPQYDLPRMTAHMLATLSARQTAKEVP